MKAAGLINVGLGTVYKFTGTKLFDTTQEHAGMLLGKGKETDIRHKKGYKGGGAGGFVRRKNSMRLMAVFGRRKKIVEASRRWAYRMIRARRQ